MNDSRYPVQIYGSEIPNIIKPRKIPESNLNNDYTIRGQPVISPVPYLKLKKLKKNTNAGAAVSKPAPPLKQYSYVIFKVLV